MLQVVDLISRGGALLVPIVLASLIGGTILIERLLYLRRAVVLGDRASLAAVRVALETGDEAALDRALVRLPTALGRILQRGMDDLPHASPAQLRASMEGAARGEMYALKVRNGAVAATAAVSPLLGLLGTVVGMITTFQGVVLNAQAGSQSPDVAVLADGIWVALLTTAAGLIVAIPLYLGHRLLVGRVKSLVHELEEFARALVDAFACHRATAGSERIEPRIDREVPA